VETHLKDNKFCMACSRNVWCVFDVLMGCKPNCEVAEALGVGDSPADHADVASFADPLLVLDRNCCTKGAMNSLPAAYFLPESVPLLIRHEERLRLANSETAGSQGREVVHQSLSSIISGSSCAFLDACFADAFRCVADHCKQDVACPASTRPGCLCLTVGDASLTRSFALSFLAPSLPSSSFSLAPVGCLLLLLFLGARHYGGGSPTGDQGGYGQLAEGASSVSVVVVRIG
jgi:hypothetical protein